MTTPGLPPELDELLAQSRAATADALATINESKAQLEVAYEQQRAEREAVQREYTERARSGEYGEDHRRLQARVDMGQSDLLAVLEGRDDSAEAAAIRTTFDANATAFTVAAAEQADLDRVEGRPDPRDGVRAAIDEVRAALAEAAAMNAALNQENRDGQ